METRIAVLASGGGTNLQALIDAWRAKQFTTAQLVLVLSNKSDAPALQRANKADIPTVVVEPQEFKDKEAYDIALIKILNEYKVNLVCLAGYMRILTNKFVSNFSLKILNIHPSLLPSFGGQGMYGKYVHKAVINSGVRYSGCTVHFVDEGTDTGPIILQTVVPVKEKDTPENLAERVLIEEHRAYPRAVALFCEGRLQVTGRKVYILEKA